MIAKFSLIILGGSLLIFTLNFFRDPERTTPDIKNGVISPADGKVISITRIQENEFIGGQAQQVSIFMSPLNVHVNRIPMSGAVTFFRYIEGEYFMAFEEKSSDRNERTLIGIENGTSKVLFKQIAGFIARRIVCSLQIGDSVHVGDRFGMIKFGSRVDVILPPEAEIRIRLNDIAVAGETVIALMPDK
jgi:phosphatidylserine decarboxylase